MKRRGNDFIFSVFTPFEYFIFLFHNQAGMYRQKRKKQKKYEKDTFASGVENLLLSNIYSLVGL